MVQTAVKLPVEYVAIIEAIAGSDERSQQVTPKRLAAMQPVWQMDRSQQREMALAMAVWLGQGADHGDNWGHWYKVQRCLLALLRRTLPFNEEDIVTLLAWAQTRAWFGGATHMLKIIENYLKDNPMTEAIQGQIQALLPEMEKSHRASSQRSHRAPLEGFGPD